MIRRGGRIRSLACTPHPLRHLCYGTDTKEAKPFPFYHVTPQEFLARREHLFTYLRPNSIVILPAADDCIVSQDILHASRQESVFYHLFGLHEPMRKSLCPLGCSNAYPDNFRLTCAVFAKFGATSPKEREEALETTTTMLFMPRKTSDAAVLPWSAQTRSLADYQIQIGGLAGEGKTRVLENDLETLVDSLTGLIEEMVCSAIAVRGGALFAQGCNDNMTRSTLRASNPLPRLFVNLPRQLRWTGETLRLPYSREHVPTSRVAFTHPLEALMKLLYSLEVKAVSRQVPDIAFCCRYQQPSARSLLPGLANPSAQEQHALRELFPAQLVRHCAVPPLSLPGADPSHASEDTPLATGAPTFVSLANPIQLPSTPLNSYRLFKSPGQVAQQLYSAAATHRAFVASMQAAAQTTQERVIHNAFEAEVLRSAMLVEAAVLLRSAYIPVVAVGHNATQIHYTANNAAGRDGDLCRLDAGVELDLVPTDCTRTFPVGSADAFWRNETSPERRLYDGVLSLQRELLRSVAAGADLSALADLHVALTVKLLCQLVGNGPAEEHRDLTQLVRDVLCAHSYGHLFGLDIHEALPPRTLEDRRPHTLAGGMMHTVEPGFYVPAAGSALHNCYRSKWGDVAGSLSRWAGMGVQIEDDVLVLPPENPTDGDRQTSGSCTWTRKDYLLAVCEAYSELERFDFNGLFLMSLPDPGMRTLLLGSKKELSRKHWVALLVVLMQRLSMEGETEAKRHLPSDISRIQQQWDSTTSWYPFQCVVTTAFIPKDVHAMAQIMRATRR